jgi:hypothetical protein
MRERRARLRPLGVGAGSGSGSGEILVFEVALTVGAHRQGDASGVDPVANGVGAHPR